uniref:Uncharacterized protein n=1 Tax=Populus trichocarpa TaxID=3694 RepID=A0A2K1XY06_POPTR
MRRGDETGEEVVLIGHERLEMGGRRGGGPRAGIAFCIRKHERSRAGQFGGSPLDWNTGAAARLAPRPRGGARRRGTASHSSSTEGQATRRTRRISKGQATRRTRRISKGQATGRGGKRRGQSCGGLSAPARKSRTRRISKGQGTGRGGKRRGQSCGGLSAPARKTEARPRQRAHHATRGSGHRRRDVAASRRPRSSCQHLGTSTANECHAHAADKQPQRARRLGAGPEDGGRNRVVAGRKTGHRCRQYFGP